MGELGTRPYPEQTLHLIDLTHDFVDHYGVGKLNTAGKGLTQELNDLEHSIDWHKFRSDAEAKLKGYGKSYKIKAALVEATKDSNKPPEVAEEVATAVLTGHIQQPLDLKLKDDERLDEAGECIVVPHGVIHYRLNKDDGTYEYGWEAVCGYALHDEDDEDAFLFGSHSIARDDMEVDCENGCEGTCHTTPKCWKPEPVKQDDEDDDVGEAQQSEDAKHQDPDIPQALRSADHWVLTSNRYGVNIFGEAYPLHPETGETITWKSPDFWLTYDQAVDALKQNRHKNLDGLGFVVARDGAEPSIIGGTINCCRDPETGTISKWVDKFLKDLDCPYCLSFTGTGLHFFCFGTLPHDAFFNATDDLTDEMKAHIIAKKPDIKTQIANGKKVWNEFKIFSNNTQHLALTDTWLGAVDLEDRAEVLQGLIKPCLEMGKIFKNKLVDEAALPSEDVMKKAREDALRLMNEALLEGNESAWAKPENVKLLKFLKEYDLETYYSVMSEWKRILPTCEIKKIVNDEIRDEKQDDPKPNPAKRVVDAIVGAEFELWHSKNGLGFITINGTHMTIRDATFANYLTTTYYNEMDDVLSPIPLKAAVETLHGMAMNEDRPEYEVVTRIALCGDVIYLDMANKDNEVIEVVGDAN